MASITRCDKCGVEIGLNTGHTWIRVRPYKKYSRLEMSDYSGKEYRYDLCDECAEKLRKFIGSDGDE